MAKLTRGRLKKIVRAYRQVLSVEPANSPARLKVARALRLLGRNEEAIEDYRLLADVLGAEGNLLGAISACKSILEIAPKHSETQLKLAQLYTLAPPESAGRVAIPVVEVSAKEATDEDVIVLSDWDLEAVDAEPDADEEIFIEELDGGWERIAEGLSEETDELLLQVVASPEGGSGGGAHGAKAVTDQAEEGGEFPDIPLFNSLGREAFVHLVESMERRRLRKGEVLVDAGEGTDAIYVVARGTLQALRAGLAGNHRVLARLGVGDFVGEFQFLTGAPSRVEVSAEEPTEVFRISYQVMETVVKRYPEVEDVLWGFFEDRMVHSLLATSPIFKSLGADQQLSLGRQFNAKKIEADEALFAEGQPLDGLFLVVTGSVEVSVKGEGEARRLAKLGAGEFVGINAAATGDPPAATAVALEPSMVLVLPASTFQSLLDEQPEVRRAVEAVRGMRRLVTDALFHGPTSYAVDGIMSND